MIGLDTNVLARYYIEDKADAQAMRQRAAARRLIESGKHARLDRYIGYYKPYATSHDELDRDLDVQEEVRNVARAVVQAVADIRAGKLTAPDAAIKSPRPK